ncbi:HPF/RaiA family ribosome-associated protein [Nocardia stercoris]|uniref:HPF/RaiA family ribosome-associated protein n=2 Tax=Nocardia stercoris TaxID=2483361 RepID=A0A3M2L743_9NOCA|nr:HPF/RaiA family ribosome-associated protein [Nocardia stercoris]
MGAAAYAQEKIGRVLRHVSVPVLAVQVRLTRHRDPVEPIIAQANVDMNGRAVRVQVAASSTREAVDLLEARLRARLDHLARHHEAVRCARPDCGPATWQHGRAARTPLPYFPRPVEQREVVRHKSFALTGETCDEAAFDMELMDHDFHLFTEHGSGIDSVLYRADGEFLLAQLEPRSDTVTRGALPVTVSPLPAPTLTVDGAIERLELTGVPFVFFRDPNLRRGCVLYHRYDGHYGLITPTV